MRAPPQKPPSARSNAAIHGYSSGSAGLPPTIRSSFLSWLPHSRRQQRHRIILGSSLLAFPSRGTGSRRSGSRRRRIGHGRRLCGGLLRAANSDETGAQCVGYQVVASIDFAGLLTFVRWGRCCSKRFGTSWRTGSWDSGAGSGIWRGRWTSKRPTRRRSWAIGFTMKKRMTWMVHR